jgi:hypothetical protein
MNKHLNINELMQNTTELKQRYDDLLQQSNNLLTRLEGSANSETIIHSKQEQNSVPDT